MVGEPRPAAPDAMEPGLRGVAGTYTLAFGRRPCVVVSDSPKAGLPLRRISHYASRGGLVTRTLYTYSLPQICRAEEQR